MRLKKVVQKIKHLGPTKKFHFCWPKILSDQIFFLTKTFFRTKNFFGPKIILRSKIIFGPEICLDPTFFQMFIVGKFYS